MNRKHILASNTPASPLFQTASYSQEVRTSVHMRLVCDIQFSVLY